MIEEASPGDAEDILAVINTSNREAFKCVIPKEHFREPILSPEELTELFRRMTFYIHRSEGKILGVAALSLEDAASGQIRWVYILPAYQRKGIGKALVRHVEDVARQEGLRNLSLHSAGTAIWAIEFYRKLGYLMTGKIDRPWGFDVVLEKEVV
jgi:GNAT superfamily N-acetyltransferase